MKNNIEKKASFTMIPGFFAVKVTDIFVELPLLILVSPEIVHMSISFIYLPHYVTRATAKLDSQEKYENVMI